MLLGVITEGHKASFSQGRNGLRSGQDAWRMLTSGSAETVGSIVRSAARSAEAAAEHGQSASCHGSETESLSVHIPGTHPEKVTSCETAPPNAAAWSEVPGEEGSEEPAGSFLGSEAQCCTSQPDASGQTRPADSRDASAAAAAQQSHHDASLQQGTSTLTDSTPDKPPPDSCVNSSNPCEPNMQDGLPLSKAADTHPACARPRPQPAGDAVLAAWRAVRRAPLEGTLLQEIGCARCGAALGCHVSAMLALSLPLPTQEVREPLSLQAPLVYYYMRCIMHGK